MHRALRPDGFLLLGQLETTGGYSDLFAPVGVVVNGDLEIPLFRGQTGRFLEPASDTATLNLLRMAREGLSLELRAAIHRAERERQPVRKEGLRCRANGGFMRVTLAVFPVRRPEIEEPYFLVLFQEEAPGEEAPPVPPPAAPGEPRPRRGTGAGDPALQRGARLRPRDVAADRRGAREDE